MSDEQKPYEVPKGILCPRCGQVIEFGQGVSTGAANVFRKGVIMVCSKCAQISIVGDSKLEPMTKEAVLQLPQAMRAQLYAICNAIAMEATKRN